MTGLPASSLSDKSWSGVTRTVKSGARVPAGQNFRHRVFAFPQFCVTGVWQRLWRPTVRGIDRRQRQLREQDHRVPHQHRIASQAITLARVDGRQCGPTSIMPCFYRGRYCSRCQRNRTSPRRGRWSLGGDSDEQNQGPCVGKSLVGDGNEVAHIDLILGPRGSAAEIAFANCLTNQKEGHSALLAVIAPNLMAKPPTVMFNKVTIKGAKQAIQMFGPAQHAVAKAVADSLADGTIPEEDAEDLFIRVGVFIHWDAADDKKIQSYNYQAVRESIARAIKGEPRPSEVVAKRDQVKHPFAS